MYVEVKSKFFFTSSLLGFFKKSATKENRSIILYCWRGGMRSHMVAVYLQSCGFGCSV